MVSAVLLSVWVAAAGRVDVDGDGIKDRIRIESADAQRYIDELPCAGCGDQMSGRFDAMVTLSKSGRTVRTPLLDHEYPEWWFWTWSAKSTLAIADYNHDGRPDFNLGQFTNSNKWEYLLFTIHEDGRVEPYAIDKPEIYVASDDEPSTAKIEVIPGGMRFRDFGNAGDQPGWWTFTCRWLPKRGEFKCEGRPGR